MNRDTIIGFVLIALVLIGFSWWNQPSAEQVEAARKQDSIALAQKDSIKKVQQQAAATKAATDSNATVQADTTALFYAAHQGKAEKVVLKNGKLTLTLNSYGGTIEKAVIHNFQSIDGSNDVTLFDGKDQQMNFMLAGKQENIVTNELYFTPTDVTDSTVTMMAQAANGGHIALRYRLGKDYMLSMALETKGLSGMFAPAYKEMDIECSAIRVCSTKRLTVVLTTCRRLLTRRNRLRSAWTGWLSATSSSQWPLSLRTTSRRTLTCRAYRTRKVLAT